jgi:hypothetical protein
MPLNDAAMLLRNQWSNLGAILEWVGYAQIQEFPLESIHTFFVDRFLNKDPSRSTTVLAGISGAAVDS